MERIEVIMRRTPINRRIQIAGIVAWCVMFTSSLLLTWDPADDSPGYRVWVDFVFPLTWNILQDPLDGIDDAKGIALGIVLALFWSPILLFVMSCCRSYMPSGWRWFTPGLLWLSFVMTLAFIPMNYYSIIGEWPSINEIRWAFQYDLGWSYHCWAGSFLLSGLLMTVAELVLPRESNATANGNCPTH